MQILFKEHHEKADETLSLIRSLWRQPGKIRSEGRVVEVALDPLDQKPMQAYRKAAKDNPQTYIVLECLDSRQSSGNPWIVRGSLTNGRLLFEYAVSKFETGQDVIKHLLRDADQIRIEKFRQYAADLRAHAKITSRLGHRISGSPLNAAHSQNPRHIDGYASDFAPSDRSNLTPTCAPKREVIFAWALRKARGTKTDNAKWYPFKDQQEYRAWEAEFNERKKLLHPSQLGGNGFGRTGFGW